MKTSSDEFLVENEGKTQRKNRVWLCSAQLVLNLCYTLPESTLTVCVGGGVESEFSDRFGLALA
jgi:hypothetical protein